MENKMETKTFWKRELDGDGNPINVQYDEDGNKLTIETPDFLEER